MNNRAQIAGFIQTSDYVHATLWSAGRSVDLGTLGGAFSLAYGLNDSGTVVGMSHLAESDETGRPYWHATMWNGTTMTDLGTLGGTRSTAISVNNAGVIVGISRVSGDNGSHATIWEGLKMRDLGTLGGSTSFAEAINESGTVAGYSYLQDNHSQHATVWSGNSLTDLGTLGGENSFASVITEDGIVAGNAQTLSGVYHATIWKDEKTIDLNYFLNQNSVEAGWRLIDVVGIDATGAIYGNQYNSLTLEFEVYKLIPNVEQTVDEPQPSTLLIIGMIGIFVARRGRGYSLTSK